MRWRFGLILLLGLRFGASASEPKCSVHLTYESASVTRGMNMATPSLLRVVADEHRRGNFLISPVGVLQALQAISLGGGPLAPNLNDFLGVDALSPAQTRAGFGAVNAKLNEGGASTTLRTSLSLWANAPFQLPPELTEELGQVLGASGRSADFASPEALAEINRAVSLATDGEIPRLLEHLDVRTKLLLVSTLFIEGQWQKSFTSVRPNVPFERETGGSVNVDIMSVQSHFRFARTRAFDVVQLPTRDGRIILEIYLPNLANARTSFLADAAEPVALESRLVALRLPKFRMAWSGSLLEPLDQLTHLARRDVARDLRVTEFHHATVLEVGRHGLRGAAGTAAGLQVMGIPPQADYEMFVNRSFGLRVLFSEAPSTLELFRGWVDHPESF